MPSTTQTQVSGGIGFTGALFLLFVGLKLGGAISWSWWLIFSPFWVPVAGVVAACTAVAVGFAIVSVVAYLFSVWDRK